MRDNISWIVLVKIVLFEHSFDDCLQRSLCNWLIVGMGDFSHRMVLHGDFIDCGFFFDSKFFSSLVLPFGRPPFVLFAEDDKERRPATAEFKLFISGLLIFSN
mmetsp:Transcript_17161/g.26246  ORF Transcript_17161/g.26246 Transcript_17161/m.26246 type:complete len:103 (-) Transcript_17161:185-493(-)